MATSRGGDQALEGAGDDAPAVNRVSARADGADALAPEISGSRVELSSLIGKHLVLAIGLLVATAMFVISGIMNFRFGMTLGEGSVDPLLYGVASLTSDGFKALLPFIAIGLWRARKPLLTLAAASIWCLCVAWSLASAMGFATSTRDETIATRSAVNEERTALSQRAARLERQIALLPAHRPAGVVEAAIANADVPRVIWNRTRQCTDVTIPESLRACQPVLDLRRELAIAQDGARLEEQLFETRRLLGGVKVIGARKDPQAETISGLLGVEPDAIRAGLAVLITVLIEAGSALGFTLVALGAGQLKVRRLPQKFKLTAEQKSEIAQTLMERRLEALRLNNVKEEAALAEARVAIEQKLTDAILAIAQTQELRPLAKRGATSEIDQPSADAPQDAAPTSSAAASEQPQPPPPEIPDWPGGEGRRAAPPTLPAPSSSPTEAEVNQDSGLFRPEDENQDASAERRAGRGDLEKNRTPGGETGSPSRAELEAALRRETAAKEKAQNAAAEANSKLKRLTHMRSSDAQSNRDQGPGAPRKRKRVS